MRAFRDRRVVPLMQLYTRSLRHAALPVAGGIDDQEARVLEAFDVMADATARMADRG